MDQKRLVKFFTLWVGLAIVLLILTVVLFGNLVLGSANITKPVSALVFSLILSIVFSLLRPAAARMDLKIKDERVWVAISFAANIVVIWIIKRLANITAVGISSILFVLIVATIVTLSEIQIEKYTKKSLKLR